MTKTNNTNVCCYIIKMLKEINEAVVKNKVKEEEMWFMELIYLKLEKDKKLCQKHS